jgi:hypothetical protein
MGREGSSVPARRRPPQLDDIDQAVDELTIRGVAIQRYEGFQTDDKGVYRGEGPNG